MSNRACNEKEREKEKEKEREKGNVREKERARGNTPDTIHVCHAKYCSRFNVP
jgi:hypothetical protein